MGISQNITFAVYDLCEKKTFNFAEVCIILIILFYNRICKLLMLTPMFTIIAGVQCWSLLINISYLISTYSALQGNYQNIMCMAYLIIDYYIITN